MDVTTTQSRDQAVLTTIGNHDYLAAIHRWWMDGGAPVSKHGAQYGLEAAAWEDLVQHLLAMGWVSLSGEALSATHGEGWQCLQALSELHRGYVRQPRPEKVRLFAHLQNAPRGAAADIGCGGGYITHRLAEMGFDPIYAYDLLPVSLAITQIGAAASGGRVETFCTDATTLKEIPDASLSLMFSSGAMHYLNHRRHAPHIGRVLKPGGWLVTEQVGLEYYRQGRLYRDLKRARRGASSVLTLLRTFLYEISGRQFRFGTSGYEVGWTHHSLKRFGRWANLRLVEIAPDTITRGFTAVYQKPNEPTAQ